MKLEEICDLANDIRCRDLEFEVTRETEYSPIFLRAAALRPNLADPAAAPAMVRGRKWFLSEHATRSEIVQTAFAAALHFEEHELREAFTYRGKAVLGPHFDVDDLVALAAVRGKAGARP